MGHILIPHSREGQGSILTLDLGTYAGWCDCNEAGEFRSGFFNFGKKKFPKIGDRYLAFRVALINYNNKLKDAGQRLGIIYYEQVTFKATGPRKDQQRTTASIQRWGGWEAILTSWAAGHRIPCEPVHTSTLKKSAAGSGHAPKDNDALVRLQARLTAKNQEPYVGPTVDEAVRALGFSPRTGDECDAIALMIHALKVERLALAS